MKAIRSIGHETYILPNKPAMVRVQFVLSIDMLFNDCAHSEKSFIPCRRPFMSFVVKWNHSFGVVPKPNFRFFMRGTTPTTTRTLATMTAHSLMCSTLSLNPV